MSYRPFVRSSTGPTAAAAAAAGTTRHFHWFIEAACFFLDRSLFELLIGALPANPSEGEQPTFIFEWRHCDGRQDEHGDCGFIYARIFSAIWFIWALTRLLEDDSSRAEWSQRTWSSHQTVRSDEIQRHCGQCQGRFVWFFLLTLDQCNALPLVSFTRSFDWRITGRRRRSNSLFLLREPSDIARSRTECTDCRLLPRAEIWIHHQCLHPGSECQWP